jgi:basic membrane protein A and related proteins
MRRPLTLATILTLAFATFAVALAACGGDDDEGGNGGGGGGGGGDAGGEAASDYRVAMLTTGTLNNRSWANSWADGAERARDELGVQLEMVGNVDAPDQYLSQGSAFAAEGYDLVIFAYGAAHEQAVRVARQFPDTQVVLVFQHASEEEAREQDPPNVGHVDPEQAQVTFLAGVLAGLMTETNTIGSVYAFPFPALTRQPEGFELGARCVNDQIEALQRRSDSFTDAAAARAAASTMIDQGADFVISAVDQAVQGVIQAAAQADRAGPGPFAIPSYFDSNDLNPEAVITSVLYGLDAIAFDLIERGVNGELGDHFSRSYTLEATEGAGLAPFYEQEELVGQENMDRLEQVREMIVDGTITIPDEIVSDPEVAGGATIGQPGSAAKIDVADIGCDDAFRSELGL